MALGDYLVGVVFFSGIWGGAAYVAAMLVRRRLPRLVGAPMVLAYALLFIAALLLVHLVPGSLGLLSREAVLATALAAALLAWRIPTREAPVRRSPPPLVPSGRVSSLIGGVALVAVSVYVAATFVRLAADAPTHVDALSFGLPGIAHWIRSGSLWDTGAFLPLYQVRTYPNNGDVVFLASILPWSDDAFVRFPTLPLLGMTGLGVYAVGRELRAPASVAVLLTAVVLATKSVTVPALQEIKPDVFMYATFTAGVVFLLRHVRTRATTDLLLAGLGLGLSFGSRWYGVSSVVVVIAVWGGSLLLARTPARRVLRDTAVLSGTVIAAGGYWFVRNALLTGNPIYPIKVAPLGVTVLDAPRDILTEKIGLTIADRLDQPDIWRETILPAYSDVIGFPGLLVLIGTLLALVLAWIGRRGESGRWVPAGAPLGAAVAALGLVAAYSITPGSAQGFEDVVLPGIVAGNSRWLMPALLVGAGVTAWVLSRFGRARVAAEVAAFAAVLLGIRLTFDVTAWELARVGFVMAPVAGAGVLIERAWPRLFQLRREATAVGVALVALAGLVAAGYADQRRYHDKRFVGQSRVLDWVTRNAPSSHRVGFAGGWNTTFVPIYGMFGPGLENDVAYVGRIEKEQVRPYTRPRPFGEALRHERYDVLVVGRVQGPDLDRPRPPAVLEQPPEARWARVVGFTEVARDSQYVLLASERLLRERATVRPRRNGTTR